MGKLASGVLLLFGVSLIAAGWSGEMGLWATFVGAALLGLYHGTTYREEP